MDFKGSCCNYSESSHLAIMSTRYFKTWKGLPRAHSPDTGTSAADSSHFRRPSITAWNGHTSEWVYAFPRSWAQDHRRLSYSAKHQRARCWRSAHPPPWPWPGCHPRLLAVNCLAWRCLMMTTPHADVPTGPIWFWSFRVWCPQHKIGSSWCHQLPRFSAQWGRPKGAAVRWASCPAASGRRQVRRRCCPDHRHPHWAWKA